MRRKKRKLYWSFISKDRQGLTAENIKEGIPGIGNSIVQNLTDVEKQGELRMVGDYCMCKMEKSGLYAVLFC